MNDIKPNFIYPDIKDTDFQFGDGQIAGTVLNPSGDWRPFTPPEENQNVSGVESANCYIEAQQHTVATILEGQYKVADQNYSGRFNANFSGGTPSGGDPLKAAQTFRDYGLIPDEMLAFTEDIHSWLEFVSFKGGDRQACINAGKEWLKKWDPYYDIVVRREYDVKTKYAKLKDALKYSPCPVSVAQGYHNGLPKPEGATDIHLVELVYIDEKNCPYVWDSYYPYIKKLAPFYNFDFGMRWTIEKPEVEEIKKSIITSILQAIPLLQRLVEILKKKRESLGVKLGSISPFSSLVFFLSNLLAPRPLTLPVEPPRASSEALQPYKWDTPENARHSFRVICDEEGLSWKEKNLLCAVVMAESGFKNSAKCVNRNYRDEITSTDVGIFQINDWYHIGPGKTFPSVQFVLENPDKVGRWMIRTYRAGHLSWWVAFVNGSYKKYL